MEKIQKIFEIVDSIENSQGVFVEIILGFITILILPWIFFYRVIKFLFE